MVSLVEKVKGIFNRGNGHNGSGFAEIRFQADQKAIGAAKRAGEAEWDPPMPTWVMQVISIWGST